MVALFDPDLLSTLLSGEAALGAKTERLWEHFRPCFGPAAGEDADRQVEQAMLLDGERYLPGDLNVKIDRASMAVGLELRCPFQDHKVMELAYSLPAGWRSRGRQGKYLLRQAAADLLPWAVKRRKKAGFGVPLGEWFRRDLRELFRDIVLSRRALERGYFRQEAIEGLLTENDAGRQDHGQRLWSLLMLEMWHRHYLDGQTHAGSA